MHSRIIARSVVGIAAFGVLLMSVVNAGPLDPPPGPIQSTDAVLLNAQEIDLPYTITEPGLYRLTSDLVLPSIPTPRDGLVIAADDVTIDFNGFTLRTENSAGIGVLPKSPTLSSTTYRNITLRNGTLVGWFEGIESRVAFALSSSTMSDVHLENMAIRNCSIGAELRNGARVERCRIFDNSAFGIDLLGDGTVTDCDVYDNDGYNIGIGVYCTVRDCRVQGGSGTGIVVRASGDDNQILDCTISGCDGLGIDASSGVDHTVYRNIVTGCAGVGIAIGALSDAPIAASSATAGPLSNIVR